MAARALRSSRSERLEAVSIFGEAVLLGDPNRHATAPCAGAHGGAQRFRGPLRDEERSSVSPGARDSRSGRMTPTERSAYMRSYRQRHRERLREQARIRKRRQRQSPEFGDRERAQQRNYNRRRREDPEFVERERQRLRRYRRRKKEAA
jgi:hypothetical protein